MTSNDPSNAVERATRGSGAAQRAGQNSANRQGPRVALLRKARQAEIASHVNE